MATVHINFVNSGTRCDAHAEKVVLVIQCLLKTRLSLISSYQFCSGWDSLVLTFMGRCHWSGRPIVDESSILTFSGIISCPLVHGSSREMWLLLDVVPGVMALLVGNHIDLPDRETCHVSFIHLFVSLQMSGPIAYK